jgi:hypothetical protein
VTCLAAVELEAPGATPGAPLPRATDPDAELNRRDFLTLLGGAVMASAGSQPAIASDAAETIVALGTSPTQPLPALAGSAPLREQRSWIPLGGASRAARVLRFTNSSRNFLRSVTRFLAPDASLNGAWSRLANSLGAARVEDPAPARARRVGSPRELARAASTPRLRAIPRGRDLRRAALRRGLALGVRHAARHRRAPAWAAIRHAAHPSAASDGRGT